MEELFRDFWWLIFPFFGMGMAAWGTWAEERRHRNAVDLIRHYTEQGKEPPAELLKVAAKGLEGEDASPATPVSQQRDRLWTFFIFAGLAAGFATGYAFAARTEDWAWVFLAVAVAMAVMAVGALIVFIFGGKR